MASELAGDFPHRAGQARTGGSQTDAAPILWISALVGAHIYYAGVKKPVAVDQAAIA